MAPTLRARINVLVCVTLLSIGILLAVGIYGYSQFRFKSLYEKERERLSAALTSQTNAILMTYLISEQQAGLDLLLSKFAIEESLSRSTIVKKSPPGFESCMGKNAPVNCLSSDSSSIGILAPIQDENTHYAYLFKQAPLKDTNQTTTALMIVSIMLALLLAFLLLFFTIARITSSIIPDSLHSIANWLKNVLSGKENQSLPNVPYAEFAELVIQMNEIVKQHQAQKMENERLQNEKVKFQLAQQVAHDIRSPLAALTMVTSHLQDLPEETRLLVRSAVQRIHDIANDLAGKKIKTSVHGEISQGQDELSLQLLSGIVDTLVSEKRMQYRAKIGIEIDAQLEASSYGLFAEIQPVEFKRVLSNLINNAVEVLTDGGRVAIKLFADQTGIKVQVSDNGKGIPTEILSKLMQRGETYGKAGGSGLGLYHARKSVEAWGGSAEINSVIGRGTTVTLTLPRKNAPEWFVPELQLSPESIVVILDDDNSIHQIWKGRFESSASNHQIKLVHFSMPTELAAWYKAQSEQNERILFLCDYEFIGSDKTGLDVIRELGIERDAVLVTSRFEEDAVRRGCEELNLRLIPKNLAGFVPIVCVEKKTKGAACCAPTREIPDAVLIDDDELVHMNWKMTAKRKNKILRAYTGSAEFWSAESELSKDTPIYIDSNLSDDIKGEDVAKELSGKGYENLYLATGYDASSFKAMPWLKGIVGKAPPWSFD